MLKKQKLSIEAGVNNDMGKYRDRIANGSQKAEAAVKRAMRRQHRIFPGGSKLGLHDCTSGYSLAWN